MKPMHILTVLLLAPMTKPPHSPTPVPVLTVSGAPGAKAISLQSMAP